MTRFCEELVGFWPAFDDPRFDSARAERKNIFCDERQHGVVNVFCHARSGFWIGKEWGGIDQEIQGAFEAELPEVELVFFGALPDQMADEIVGDEEHEDFFFDHGG